jgi:Zn-dependent protease with chaperone function
MHLLMISVILSIAGLVRLVGIAEDRSWQTRWQRALLIFLFPPLLILSTAIALLCMGVRGQMMGFASGWISYAIAALFFTYSLFLVCKSSLQGYNAAQKIASYPTQLHLGQLVYVLELDYLFAAQIGFWQPKLVVSKGLLQKFDTLHLNAVLKHEEAHLFYRDTFWFFCLGCLRQISQWLPHSDRLWQELLLLREVRADRWAVQQVDALILAESLLWSVSDMGQTADLCTASLSDANLSRLEARIELLLSDELQISDQDLREFPWGWLILTGLPLISVLLHS